MNSLREHLHIIEERILGWPDNVPLWAPDTDPDVAFEGLEVDLQQLLAQIAALPAEDRAEFKPLISAFHENIHQHHIATEQRLKEMQSVVDTSFQYVKAVRAYTIG
jgi:hypothetical protein